jgi:hypothetical protein
MKNKTSNASVVHGLAGLREVASEEKPLYYCWDGAVGVTDGTNIKKCKFR